MGGTTVSNKQEKIANIALQTSSYGTTISKVYGTARVTGNLIWYGNFKATAHTTKTTSGGKGVGKVTTKDTSYTYTASVMMALGEGPIPGVGAVWKGKDKVSLADLGLTLFSGAPGQLPWPFLQSHNTPTNWPNDGRYGYYDYYNNVQAPFTDQVLGYSSTAYLASAAYDLGTDASVPNHGFEVIGSHVYGGGVQDADPAAVFADIVTSTQYGAGLSSSFVGDLTSYSNYCVALGLFVSPAYVEQRATSDVLKELTDLTNSGIVWSGGKLKVIPYGDQSVTGNGKTYTPNLTPLYDLSDDDFLASDNPVRIKRSSSSDAKNRVAFEFSNRANQYNTEVVSVEDQDAIERFGLKPSDNISAKIFCLPEAAKMSAQLALQRMLYKRNEYQFAVNSRYPMLEPMDLVTITDSGLGLDRLPVRITEITETDDGYEIVAEDLNIGVASAAAYAHDNGLRWQSTINAKPQSAQAPYIFELPPDPTTTGLALGIATGAQSGDLIYGGCRVWVSFDDVNYRQVATLYGSSRYGTITASYPMASGIYSAQPMEVLLAAGGQILSGSPADAANAATLMVMNNEFMAHQDATLVSANNYDLSPVNRGLYGTPPQLHPSGSKWARVDQAIARVSDLDLSLIGRTVYVKLTAFNTYDAGEQDLSEVSAYTYAITGWAKELKTQEPGVYVDIIASRSQITYNGAGVASPTSQTTTFDVRKQGILNSVVVVMSKTDGTSIDNPQVYLTPNTPTAINLIPYSDQFSSWAGVATVDSDYAVAPDGTMTADRITDSNGSGFDGRQQSITIPADGTVYICSWFLKKTTGVSNCVMLRVNLQGGTAQVNLDTYVNTNTGTIRLTGGASATIKSIGDYWLVQSTATNNGTNTGLDMLVFPAIGFNVGDQPAPTPDAGATGSVVVWRASASYSFDGYLIQTGAALRRGIVTDNVSLTEPNFASASSGSTGVRVTALAGETSGVIVDTASLYRNQSGADGLTNALVKIYQRASGTPALPNVTATYTFATNALTGLNNGWTQSVPAADGNPLYVAVAVASGNGATDTIAAGEWSSPVVETGAGINTAAVFIYQRTTTNSAPAAPSTTATFNFATGVITGLNNGWTADLPASGGPYRWRRQAAASSTGPTDTIAAGEWAAARLLAEDGTSSFTVSPASQSFVIAAYSNGTPKNLQLPKTVTFMVLQGATDISNDAGTTYSVSASNCTATLGGTNNKVLTISAMAADSATATVTVRRSATTIATVVVTLEKSRDGATGGTSNVDTTLAINNTSSYSGTQGGPFTVPVGPNGTISLNVDHGYSVGANTATLSGKVQYRTTPGSGAWIDVGSEVSGTIARAGEPGALGINQTLSGPASAATWEFQYINRKTGAGTLSNSGAASFYVGWGA